MGLLDGMDQARRACSLAPALERARTALADDTPPAALRVNNVSGSDT